MDIYEESRLEREGALAAAAGLSWQANPYLKRESMPAATGEPFAEWARKHDAWLRGYEGHQIERNSGGSAA
ncbi:MAG TPA: CrpP-related protein [Burkholderiaceae bacterium]|nr:CrpP-related protein [Burkholderiaceae bacterium]